MSNIFICYSHKDESFVNDLLPFLNVYSPEMEHWHDRNLGVGDEWKKKILAAIDRSNGAILIISTHFLTSKFILDVELPKLLVKKKSEGMEVFPLLVRSCDFGDNDEISKLQVRPLDAKPLNSYRGHRKENILKDFAIEIKDRILLESTPIQSDLKPEKKVDRKVNLDSLFEHFEILYNEINYLPVHSLMRQWPFSDGTGSQAYYHSFNASIDSEKLMAFILALEIRKNGDVVIDQTFSSGVANANEKVRQIVQRLSDNLIFQISHQKSREFKTIRIHAHRSCDCIRCRYNRFNYLGVFELLDTPANTTEEKLIQAYHKYRVGQFVSSAETLVDIQNDIGPIRNYICSFNLKSLGNVIWPRFFGDDSQEDLMSRIREIDMDQIYAGSYNEETGVIKYIHNNDFLLSAERKIDEYLEKLRKHYEHQTKGGFSSLNHGWNLLDEYLQIHTFITANHLIYDQFSEFRNIAHRVIEGIFLSYLIDQTNNGRIEKIDDFIVFVIVNYGKADDLRKLCFRYGLRDIPYETSNEHKLDIFGVFHQFLDQGLSIMIDERIESRHFREIFNSHFSNLLTLLGLIEIEGEKVDELKNSLLDFLEKESILFPNHTDSLLFFLFSPSKQKSPELMIRLLFHMLGGNSIFRFDGLEKTANHIRNNYEKIELSSQESDDLIEKFRQEIERDNSGFRLSTLVNLSAGVKNDELSAFTAELVNSSLDERYGNDLFYDATIYEVIPFNEAFYNQYKEFSKPEPNRLNSMKALWGAVDDNRHSFLNEFINLSFKFEIDLSDEEEFKGVDPYYDWLLDLAGFDYTHFEPRWVYEYPTKFYYDEFGKHSQIKQELEIYLSSKKDEKVSQAYFDIFIRD